MLMGFLPRQEEFFTLFTEAAVSLTKAAQALHDEVKQLSDKPNVSAGRVLEHKRAAEAYAQKLFTLMHKSFITPFDRYDIHRLNDKLYDIVNMINLTAQRFVKYEIHSIPPMMVTLTEVCLKSAQLVQEVVSHLHDLKNNNYITKACDKIKAYESQADQLLIDGMASLFRDEKDVKNIIRLKEVYDLLESMTDRCQEVAFIVEGIVLEYA
ncbi:MAG TPA: DUF47 family protein [Gammaproteobacteria bacterium]|nr:DUF47 family protein [Gammaproteobacteria bacterium]